MWHMFGVRGTEREPQLAETLGNLHRDCAASPEFEEKGWRLLEKHMESFLQGSIQMDMEENKKFKDGCLRYDSPLKGLPPNHCNFHIRNTIAPKSILKEERYTAGCFIKLMEASEKEFGYDILRTKTWLNSLPQWLKFFPQDWQDHFYGEAEARQIGWDTGSWGQIITSRNTFNYKRGEYIRTHLELEYKPKSAWCSFASMREHLKKF